MGVSRVCIALAAIISTNEFFVFLHLLATTNNYYTIINDNKVTKMSLMTDWCSAIITIHTLLLTVSIIITLKWMMILTHVLYILCVMVTVSKTHVNISQLVHKYLRLFIWVYHIAVKFDGYYAANNLLTIKFNIVIM